ncbi:MAG: cytochrome c biogenesis protein CcsA [Opitutales bacterium]
MDLSETRDLFWLAAALYGAGLVSGLTLAAKENKLVSSLAPLALVVAGFIAQTQGLAVRGQLVKGCPLGNGMEMIQFILWSVVVGYLIIRVLFRLNLLGSFAAGLASVGGVISLVIPSLDSKYWEDEGYAGIFSNHWVELHASVAIFSYGLFALLAVVSAMYLVQQNSLSTKRTSALSPFLPSINQLEVAAARLLLVGAIFLTGSIVVGSLDWTRSPESVSMAKVGLTLALWVAYCTLWYLHFRQKLFGKRFAKACIALFVVAILSLGVVRSAKDHPPHPAVQDVD